MDILRAIFKTKTRDEWLAELADIDACVGPLYSLDEALNDPHAQARGVGTRFIASAGWGGDPIYRGDTGKTISETDVPLRTLPSFPRISGVEGEQRYAPPTLGEHTHEILREVGYTEAEIEQLKAGGAI